MKFFSSNRRIAAVAAVMVVLLLFLFRPGASRLKSRIVSSISSGVGRPVEIGSVHLRLLPRPGFDLENLVVYDDPAFGAEPMLRASELTADLRLFSLLRGRLEIARLDLTEPSLNLVHAENGRWNLEALLERTAHTPLAPTTKAKSEPRPGFPYIAATSGRINFKEGPEKKPYALINADFSLWQDSENAWGVRLKAQPFRTDLNLNDTGLLQMAGTWQRATTLHETPLQFSLEWSRAQLGQISKFLTGNDQGWRGGVQLDVKLTGTPQKLLIASNASVQDFRRYDIAGGSALRLGGHCDGQYSSLDHMFREVVCSAPVGNGSIAVKGEMGFPGSHLYALALNAENLPASAALALAMRAKKNLANDLTAGGIVHGTLSIQQSAASAGIRLEGKGEIADLRLTSAENKAEIGPETVPFIFSSETSTRGTDRHGLRKIARELPLPEGPKLEFGPLPVAVGHAPGPVARGWMNRNDYAIYLAGEAEIARTLRLGRMFGLPATQATVEGSAQLDLQIAGQWTGWGDGTRSGFLGPQVTGTVKLHKVLVGIRGTGGPIEISSAEVQLAKDVARVGKLNARLAGTSWTGSLEVPRGCGTPQACEVGFALNANQISLSELKEWVAPGPADRPWYRVLSSGTPTGPSVLTSLRASGRITADRVQVQNLTATRVSTNVKLDAGKLEARDLNAELLGGSHRGAWLADFSARPTVCSGKGNLGGASLASLATAMHDPWIEGTVDASYEIKGPCPADFWQSADGTLQFVMTDGALPRVALGDSSVPLRINRFVGQARLRAGSLEIKDAKLDSPAGKFQLSGTASLKRALDLKLVGSAAGNSRGFTIGGTLAEPRVIPIAGVDTQARLKP